MFKALQEITKNSSFSSPFHVHCQSKPDTGSELTKETNQLISGRNVVAAATTGMLR